MDYRNADWLPWYVEDTPGWLELSLAARGAMAEIQRKLNRKTGSIELRRGLPSLAGLLRVRWADELEPALGELLKAGKLTWDGDAGLLCDPDYLSRRRPTSTERVRDHRKRGVAGTNETLHPLPEPREEKSRVDQRSIDRAAAPENQQLTPHRLSRLKAICLAAGVELDPDDEWATYVADRTRKVKPISDPDWEYWLRNAVKFAKRDRATAPKGGASARARQDLGDFEP